MNASVTSRREFLMNSGGGLGGIALAAMLNQSPLMPTTAAADNPGSFHHPPRAKRVVQLFMGGGASHLDTFDYKPELIRQNGKPWDPGEKVELFQSSPGATFASPWAWKPYGQSGKHLSEITAPLGPCVDDMAFIHSMVGKTGVHSQATYLQATGFQRPGFPGAGAWVSYGLGNINQNLPTFVVLPDHRGFASNGPKNWSSAFLPGQHQGVLIQPNSLNPIEDLFPPESSPFHTEDTSETLEILSQLNRRHSQKRPGDPRLETRIKAYEIAAGMQLAAPEAMSIKDEPNHIRKLYGLDSSITSFPKEINPLEEAQYFGRKCLVARRLLERGVQFVQIWSGNDNGFPRRNWDSHEDIHRDHGPLALGMSIGVAGLIQDLKQRGLLDDTLILWTTDFGRMPCAQGGKGRDHNPFVFTNWLAGGGISGGTTYGQSDEWGFRPVEHPIYCYDVHATMLHLLGLNHTQLTYRSDGFDRRLTDVHGRVLHEIIS